jgi:hypothetical protein
MSVDYRSIVELVRRWPPEQRAALAQDILKTLATEASTSRTPRDTLTRASGLLANGAAPTDDEVKQWLDERRAGKYE